MTDNYTIGITIVSLLECAISMVLTGALFEKDPTLLKQSIGIVMLYYGYLIPIILIIFISLAAIFYVLYKCTSYPWYVFADPVSIALYRFSYLVFPIIFFQFEHNWYMIYKLCWSMIENMDAFYQYCIRFYPKMTIEQKQQLDSLRNQVNQHYDV